MKPTIKVPTATEALTEPSAETPADQVNPVELAAIEQADEGDDTFDIDPGALNDDLPPEQELEVPASEQPPAETPEVEETPAEPPKPTEAKEAAPPEPEQPKEEQPAPAAEQPQPTEQAPQQTPAEAAQQSQPEALTPEQQMAQIVETKEALQTALAEDYFKLDDKMVELMDEDPSKAVSQIASKVYVEAVTSVWNHVIKALPTLVQNSIVQTQQQQSVTDKFFDSWTQLDKSNQQHVQAIAEVAQVYKAMNPQASVDDYIRDVGLHSLARLGIPFQPAAPATPKAAPKPAAPAQPAAFQPAGAGAPSGGGPAPVSDNPFAVLNEQLILDEQG